MTGSLIDPRLDLLRPEYQRVLAEAVDEHFAVFGRVVLCSQP